MRKILSFLTLFLFLANLAAWRFNSSIFEESTHHPGIYIEPSKMSIGIYPVFKPGTTSRPFESDGVFILDHLETLWNLATANGLKPIDAFSDNRPVPEGFDGDPDELQDLLGPFDGWFPVSEGLQTLDGLIQILEKEPDCVKDREEILEELKDLAQCLRSASPEDAEFRFEAF